MKKLVLCLALATVAVSCKKIQAGGNKNIIKMEEGTERYSDDHQGGAEGHGHGGAHEVAAPAEHGHETPATDATKKDSTTAETVDKKPVGLDKPSAEQH